MGLLDMFDKVDDIIYKPVETICEWTKEPLKKWEHKRDMETQTQNIAAEERARERKFQHEKEMQAQNILAEAEKRKHEKEFAQQIADNEMAKKKLEQAMTEQERASLTADYEARAKVDADIRRWNAEIEQMILQQADERRDRLVECLKRYQLDLSNAAKDIVNSIGLMSLELRAKANEMVLEKTKEYRALQDESKKQSLLELKEVKEMFFNDDPDTYKIMVGEIMEERRSAIDLAGRFIVELSEDMKRLNQNTDDLMRMGMENANKYLAPMANGLGVKLDTTLYNTKRIEG